MIVFITSAISSIVFQSTTFALPKIFDERIQGIARDVTAWLSASGLRDRYADVDLRCLRRKMQRVVLMR